MKISKNNKDELHIDGESNTFIVTNKEEYGIQLIGIKNTHLSNMRVYNINKDPLKANMLKYINDNDIELLKDILKDINIKLRKHLFSYGE